jgi:argininosuccinate lyase
LESPSRGGAFDQAVDKRVEKFTESISFDTRLYRQDIAGSIAHAQMLAKQGWLTNDEAQAIEKTLNEIKTEIETGQFVWKTELEDVHMNIEQALIDRLDDVGRKLHTARSRNDQVATDLRLWTRDAIDGVVHQLIELQKAFVARCESDLDVILPAYTHLQRAQPVLAPHVWLAYVEKFERDRQRLMDCRKRVNICSLGTAAVAGTTLDIDRDFVADALGFDGVSANSLDVSSDRDFVLESAFCLTSIALHLSGWAEEWILWSTSEFGFLKLPQQFCTGSSIMPQKINPDVLELTRGKSARVVGNLQLLLTLVKGLPLAYNRDLQEDKPAIFDIFSTVEACLELAIGIVAGAELQKSRIEERLNDGYLDATSLMEFLIRRGLPQRNAHHLVGTVVRRATELAVPLAELSLEEFQSIDPSLDQSVYDVIGAENAVKALTSYGSSGPAEVRRQIDAWQNRLGL